MRIGELAKQTGCDIETIRYYEKAGLLPEPQRNEAGYRMYQPEHLERLQFIRHCRSLQMGLADIRVLLHFRSQPSAECQGVNDLLDHHIGLIRVRMEALQSLEQQLLRLRLQCEEPHSVGECGILQNLNDVAGINDCACHETKY
jgi:Cd(II)/Pb(II)-responsive transcriptional regulator